MIDFLMVSFWPILIAVAVNFVLGMLWYGPLFGKKWMAYVGFKEEDREDMQKAAGPAYAASLVTAFLYGYGMDLIINLTGVSSLGGALLLGGVLWLTFQIPTALKPALWEDKPKGLLLINAGYELTMALLVSIGAFIF